MKSTEINSSRALIERLLDIAIYRSFENVKNRCNRLGTSPQEPDYIASLTIDFTPNLFSILKLLYSRNKFTVSGVYCHQKPLADFGSIPAPEIGDLLFVYVHTDSRGKKRFNSLLFQAKLSSKSEIPISAFDGHQLKLYSEWPTFTYRRADYLNGETRNIQPKVANNGAQYLIIDSQSVIDYSIIPYEFPMGCAVPQNPLYLDRKLSAELINFLKFTSGRAFEAEYSTTQDDWTKLIWDLLKITERKASRRKNSGISSFNRQITELSDGLHFIQSETTTLFSHLIGINSPEIPSESFTDFEKNDSSGISIILIENEEQEVG